MQPLRGGGRAVNGCVARRAASAAIQPNRVTIAIRNVALLHGKIRSRYSTARSGSTAPKGLPTGEDEIKPRRAVEAR
jgi:hypothetical protein